MGACQGCCARRAFDHGRADVTDASQPILAGLLPQGEVREAWLRMTG